MWKFIIKCIRSKPRVTSRAYMLDGALPQPKDTRDYLASTSAEPIKRVMLDKFCSEVKQQGIASSCTAHAVVLMYEMEKRLIGEEVIEGSEQYNYFRSRYYSGLWPADRGAYLRDAVKILYKYGNCPEKLMPYNDKDINYSPGLFCDSFSKMFKIDSYYAITSIAGLKTALQQHHPVAFAIPIYSEFWSSGKSISLPKGDIVGRHAMVIVGYDEDMQAFYVQNSWGKGWGNYGFSWLPYKYFETVDNFDAWHIIMKKCT